MMSFPAESVTLVLDLQRKGWRAQLSNRTHIMLLAPDGVTRLSVSRNRASAKYLREDIARYERNNPPKKEKQVSHATRFPCPRPGCNKTFMSLDFLNDHIYHDHVQAETAALQPVVKCPDCDFTSSTKQRVAVHRTHKHGHVSHERARRLELKALKELRSQPDTYLVPQAEPEPETVQPQPAEHVEFLDERDSWVMDRTMLNQMTTLSNLDHLVKAAGLNMEIRVWRA